MVLCLIALPVFAVLGVFSLKYRRLARDAADCLFRTVTLRKCRSGLDARIQSYVTGRALRRSAGAARFLHRHFRLLSWLVAAVFVWSLVVSAQGIYNFAKYGNCNGPASTGFCLLDPTGAHSGLSDVDLLVPDDVVLPSAEPDDPVLGAPGANLTIIEFGCYACPYTKKAEDVVARVLERYAGRVNLQFKTFTIPHHNMSLQASLAADCALEQDKYLPYHQALFANQSQLIPGRLVEIARDVGLDVPRFEECLASQKFLGEVEADTQAGIRAGVMGTPTFFIGPRKIVGPKPFKTFQAVLDEVLGT